MSTNKNIYEAKNQPSPWQGNGSSVYILASNEKEAKETANKIDYLECPNVWISNDMDDETAYEYQINVWFLDGDKVANVRWFDFERVNPLTDSFDNVKKAYDLSSSVWEKVSDKWYIDAEKRINMGK